MRGMHRGWASAPAPLCLNLTIRWTRARQTFGTRLADNPVIHHKLAEMVRQTDVAREYTRAVARRFAVGEDVTREAAMAKNTAVYACQSVVHQAVQIHGGWASCAKARWSGTTATRASSASAAAPAR